MPELLPKERLQPSLLDRLTDEEPGKKVSFGDRYFLTINKLRQSVIRDLEWLLNTNNFEAIKDLSGLPFVSSSVLNYGIPDLVGKTTSGVEAEALGRLVRQAIVNFEPRILKKTVQVRVFSARDQASRRALTFEITGEMWAQPIPLQIYLRSEVDLETGNFNFSKASTPSSD
jgi:type VI secretion system protein ImpF